LNSKNETILEVLANKFGKLKFKRFQFAQSFSELEYQALYETQGLLQAQEQQALPE